MFNIGAALLTGDGVSTDAPKAAEWFEKAGALHVPEAYLNLSKMHIEGQGVPRDLNKAKQYLARIEDHNDTAQAMLNEVNQMIALSKPL
jgi:TPR repeat protein